MNGPACLLAQWQWIAMSKRRVSSLILVSAVLCFVLLWKVSMIVSHPNPFTGVKEKDKHVLLEVTEPAVDEQIWSKVKKIRDLDKSQNERNERLWKEAEKIVPGQASTSTPDSSQLVLLVLIKTGPHYFERRQNLRDLWVNRCRRKKLISHSAGKKARDAGKAVDVTCLFVAGKPSRADVLRAIDREKHSKKDIFLAPIPDGYNAMTTKTQWFLLWSLLESAIHYDYIMLIDDDAFVAFTNFLPWLLEQPRRGFYAGHEHFRKEVYRCESDPSHPNCVTLEMYPKNLYPPFASGFGYVMSKDVVKISVMQAMRRTQRPGLPGNVEDAMLGVLLREAGIEMKDMPGFVHWLDESECRLGSELLVMGNAPKSILETLYRNEQSNANLCRGIN